MSFQNTVPTIPRHGTPCYPISILCITLQFIERPGPHPSIWYKGRSASILLICSTPNHTTSYPHRTVSWSGWTGNLEMPIAVPGSSWGPISDVRKTRKRVHGEPYSMGDKVWVWANEKIKSKKFFLPWEGPYVVLAKVVEVNFQVAKLTTPGKLRFLHFNILKPYVEEEPRPDEANSSKRPIPFRSTGFFDEPVVQDEDLESAIGGQNEIRPIRLPAPHPTPPHRMRSGNQEELLPTEKTTQLRKPTTRWKLKLREKTKRWPLQMRKAWKSRDRRTLSKKEGDSMLGKKADPTKHGVNQSASE